jgi:hypothetical protein
VSKRKTISKPVKKPAGKDQPVEAKRDAALDQGVARLADKLHANA